MKETRLERYFNESEGETRKYNGTITIECQILSEGNLDQEIKELTENLEDAVKEMDFTTNNVEIKSNFGSGFKA